MSKPRLKKPDFSALKVSVKDIYNRNDDESKGRIVALASSLLAAFYNVFITGIFYTGFLSMYDISITGVGIVTFIPYIANCFSVFSFKVLKHFKRRKPILLAAKIFFYFLYIVATTAMPNFVTDPDARLRWFVIILFVAHAVYALFSPGLTVWFYNFYPKETERRTRYLTFQQIFSSIMSSLILILSGVLTDAVKSSGMQDTLIIALRYFAFGLVAVDVAMQAKAKEYPCPESENLRFSHVFTLPFRYKKFLNCMLFMFAWNYIANLNNGLWSYHLLNHMHFSYTLINLMSVCYTVILLTTNAFWRKTLRRHSWIKTFGFACLFWVPTEIVFFFMIPETAFFYVPLCLIQNVLSVGLNLSYSNVLYMNLPEENSTAHIAFYSIGANVFAFLGLMTGTFVSGITGDHTMLFLGVPVYSMQFTTLMRALFIGILAIVLIKKWKSFTPDKDIAAVEEIAKAEKRVPRKLLNKVF